MEDEEVEIRNLDEEMNYQNQKPRKTSGIRSKHKTQKNLKKPSSMKNIVLLLTVLLLIIGLVLFVLNLNKIFGTNDRLIATINGQNIYKSYYDKVFALEIPKNQTISERDFTYNFLLPRILFIQEATGLNYEVIDEDVEDAINKLFTEDFKKESLISQLNKEGITYPEFKNFTKENLLISNLLANQVKGKITVTNVEVKDFYEKYKEVYNFPGNSSNISSKLKIAIHREIYKAKESQGISLYLNQLIKKSNITIYDNTISANYGLSFKSNDQSVCKKDGKPIIRFFSTSDCQSCDWVRQAFKSAVEIYITKGSVIVYNWQLDTGDDLMTSGKEKSVAKEEFEIYRTFNEASSVPTFIFGCRYYRIGTYYDNLEQEEEEFKTIIEKLLV